MIGFIPRIVLTLLISCLCINLQAQKKTKFNFVDPSENFYDTQNRINKHYKRHMRAIEREQKERSGNKGKVGIEEEEELAGYELYKRWEYYMEPRVYPSGDKTIASRAHEEYKNFIAQNAQYRQSNNAVQSSTWQPLGPFGDPTGGNAGRINAVRFDPVNANGVWICTPDGGLWSTTTNGSSWSTNTDNLSPIGNADVCFDPTNSQIMYMATGDGDANDSYSVGVLKSTDGGSTWNTTGLNWTVSQGRRIYKMLMNPQNKNVILVASNIGIYRTTNGGTSWASVSAGAYTDIEYRPGDTTTVYAVSTSIYGGSTAFYKSTNGGSSFSSIATGLPSSANCDRFAIAVTAANSSYVYLVASSSSNDGFYGFYQSTNNGGAFSSKATSPNLLGWASAGNDTGGQGWYTLSIAASPTNANEVIVGGVNTWKTTNGGTNWTLNTHWTGSGAPYVHADCHDLIYKNGTTVYAGTDGGIFYTSNSGTSWAAINGNMNIAELYKMGNSKTTYSLAITGHQDNGTNIYSGGWSQTMGGDGMSCFIDWSNDQVRYGEQYQGSFNLTTNGGATWTGITNGISGTGAWNTPWHQDPLTANTIYGGRQQLFKSTNQGANWSAISNFSNTTSIVEFAVAPSNPQVIYVIQGGTVLYKTTNGGTSWTNITGTLPVASAKMTFVAVKDKDPNSVWVTFSGYSSGNKVFNSTNGGTSWNNCSTGLPNLPANCITYWNGTKDGLYLGCDIGVYYRDSTLSSWQIYNTGLPNVSVHDLAIYYPTAKVRAATYGRGMWEADLYNNGMLAPVANFSADKTFICAGMTVNYTDLSTFGPTSWSWTFQGGTPATSTAQNPSVVYNTAGTYSVSLTATNGNGNNTMTKTTYITVSPVNTLPLVEGFQGATFPPTNWQNYDAASDNLIWKQNTTVGKGSTACMFYDNYNQNASGTRDEMRTPKYNFSGFSTIKLYFDVAYAQYDPTYSDTLAVVVSSDCGLTYNQVYVKGGTTLATAPNYTAAIFSPTATQWRTDTVYLNAYAGMGNVMVSFQNRGRYGQAIYVDNVNIAGSGTGAAPTAVFSNPSTLCTGQSIAFTDQSTNNPTSWSWTFSGGTPATSTTQNPTVSFNTAGTHTVTLTASNSFGTSAVKTQTVTIVATPTVTSSPSSSTICSGTSAVLTGGGATTYTWSANAGSATTSTVSVSPASTTVYTVTGATSGCTNTGTATITVNTTPTVTVNSATICSGTSAILTASGATTYSWSTSATTSTISVTPATTTVYTVTGTSTGCSVAKTSTVTVNAMPAVTVNSATVCAGSAATLTAGGATTYSWSTTATTNTISVTPASTTVYTVTGTSTGCSAAKTATVTVNASPTVTVNSPSICSGASAVLTAGGATTYSWSTSATTNTISVTPASTTVYTVTGTSSGCSSAKTSTVTVTPNPTITVNNPSICAGSSAVLTAGGATTYSWSTSATTNTISVAPASTTVYSVTGTTSGCTGTNTSTVTVSPNPTVTVNSSSICSGNSTALTAAGAGTYSWSPAMGLSATTGSNVTANPASTTVYTVTGTSGSCNGTNTSTVTVSPTPTVNVNSSTICSGSPTTLSASGATTYSWSPGTGLSATSGASVSANPSSTTVYTITGTSGACSSSSTSTVTVVASLTVVVNNASICTGSTATLTASGASTYSWNTGATATTITVSPTSSTVYTVSGTSGSCSSSNTSTVTVNALPAVTFNISGSPVCNNASPVTLTGSPGGGTFSGSGVTGNQFSPNTVTSGPYVLTYSYTDVNNCTNTDTANITVKALPVITVAAVQDTICTGNSTAVNAAGASTYTWSPVTGLSAASGASVSANPTVTTTYSVSGTGANGCTNTSAITITVNGCTGISTFLGKNSMLGIYPNPGDGTFELTVPSGNAGTYSIEIRNALSQLVYADKIQVSETMFQKTITIPEVSRGVYTFLISGESGKLIRKIIVQ
jgi:PKD repeat protein